MTMLMMFHKSLQKTTAPLVQTTDEHTAFCKHCKIKLNSFVRTKIEESEFCCRGCQTAWTLIQQLNLNQFYNISESFAKTSTSDDTCDYSIFDSEEFQADFVTTSQLDSSVEKEAKLLLDGITCYACVWLIQNALRRKFSQNRSDASVTITINQSTGSATIRWTEPAHHLSQLIQFIESLGYRALPHRGNAQTSDQKDLIKVGVGLFVMMNVMSFALAEYFAGAQGLEPNVQQFMRWLSLILTASALIWPGREFFINTYRSLVSRRPHIDTPILAGLLAAFFYSCRSTYIGHGPVYFDSITAIIALVISGRFVQQNILRRNQSKMASLLNPKEGWALVKDQNNIQTAWSLTPIHKIKSGDLVKVLPGELLPLRTVCTSSCAEISFEQLQGEARWKTVQAGEKIPAGVVNGPHPIELIADQNGTDSYLNNLRNSINAALEQKGTYQQWSDRAAWFLFVFVFVVALTVLALTGRQNIDEAVSRVIAIFLVACPCTFAIGTPLAFGTAMSQALRNGILFKSQRSLEKLANVKHFIFDKTGTLTHGSLKILQWNWLDDSNNDSILKNENRNSAFQDLHALSEHSSHQVATALANYALQQNQGTSSDSFSATETLGSGIEWKNSNKTYIIGKREFLLQKNIKALPFEDSKNHTNASTLIALNGNLIASVQLDDTIKPDALPLIDSLTHRGLTYDILSGDSIKRTSEFARNFSAKPNNITGNATPMSKLLQIKSKMRQHPIAMIGNGLNDAGAMAHATVSISTFNSSSTAQNSSDICLLKDEMTLVQEAYDVSCATVKKMKTVFAVSVAYNLLGLALAATGYISPVVAAILMPISSITITKIATAWPRASGNKLKTSHATDLLQENGA